MTDSTLCPTYCTICLKFQKKNIHGDDGCPIRASFWCSQCSCSGHLASDCDVAKHVWRPRTLEELISADKRARWNITTETAIIWPKTQTLDDAEREIAETNIIEIRYREGKEDNRVREMIRSLSCHCCPKLLTVHKKDDNIHLLRSWAVKHGKKVRLVQEK